MSTRTRGRVAAKPKAPRRAKEPARPSGPEETELLDGRKARLLAGKVLSHLLGPGAARPKPLGGGLTNFVFEARRGRETFVLRLGGAPGKIKDYLKEQWAMARARESGIPVPEVLEVGTEPIGVPYMVSRKVAGTEATHHPQRFSILRQMGRFARQLHEVETSGFGATFDWSENRLSRKESWAEYLAREFRGPERLAILDRHGMLAKPALKALRATLDEIARWDPQPVLNHGDLRLKNVVAEADGEVCALLDWEMSTSNVAPYWELSIALHDLSVDAKEELLAGYGMTPREMSDAAPALRAFNVLNYAHVVEAAAEEADTAKLERLRARLHGALDLYAF